jgi:ABC-type lipoprotein release transport system permease subunit
MFRAEEPWRGEDILVMCALLASLGLIGAWTLLSSLFSPLGPSEITWLLRSILGGETLQVLPVDVTLQDVIATALALTFVASLACIGPV